ncbi:hypothetical protein Hamer_G031752 [Homarus americanus]|uniref:Transmembrane protein n=1 Tax=Homarus americanus TaxID=6706 RepID=A0A8J5TK82_HOMAM|nr:hypothetical protein Hamer_G031752 [Homarus americanus]
MLGTREHLRTKEDLNERTPENERTRERENTGEQTHLRTETPENAIDEEEFSKEFLGQLSSDIRLLHQCSHQARTASARTVVLNYRPSFLGNLLGLSGNAPGQTAVAVSLLRWPFILLAVYLIYIFLYPNRRAIIISSREHVQHDESWSYMMHCRRDNLARFMEDMTDPGLPPPTQAAGDRLQPGPASRAARSDPGPEQERISQEDQQNFLSVVLGPSTNTPGLSSLWIRTSSEDLLSDDLPYHPLPPNSTVPVAVSSYRYLQQDPDLTTLHPFVGQLVRSFDGHLNHRFRNSNYAAYFRPSVQFGSHLPLEQRGLGGWFSTLENWLDQLSETTKGEQEAQIGFRDYWTGDHPGLGGEDD